MKFINPLKNELGTFLIMLLLSIFIVGSIYLYRESVQEDKQISETRLNKIKKKYQQAKDRKRRIEENKLKIDHLTEQKIIGTEDRLSWIDALDKITQDGQIPYIKYDIAQQSQFNDRKLLSKYPGVDVYQSRMNMEMSLLHEADLYTVLNRLDKQARGLFEIESCFIKRNDVLLYSLLDSDTDANIRARCQLNWYTFRPKNS